MGSESRGLCPTKNLPTLEAQPEILFQIVFYGDPSLFLKEECQIS